MNYWQCLMGGKFELRVPVACVGHRWCLEFIGQSARPQLTDKVKYFQTMTVLYRVRGLRER